MGWLVSFVSENTIWGILLVGGVWLARCLYLRAKDRERAK